MGPSLRRTAIWLAITGVSLYLIGPSLLDVLGSWQDLDRIDWIWFPAMLVLQAGGLRACGRSNGWPCTARAGPT